MLVHSAWVRCYDHSHASRLLAVWQEAADPRACPERLLFLWGSLRCPSLPRKEVLVLNFQVAVPNCQSWPGGLALWVLCCAAHCVAGHPRSRFLLAASLTLPAMDLLQGLVEVVGPKWPADLTALAQSTAPALVMRVVAVPPLAPGCCGHPQHHHWDWPNLPPCIVDRALVARLGLCVIVLQSIYLCLQQPLLGRGYPQVHLAGA
mmetsp:Transcript_132121/g.254316  ORF Transcript_132121/g.254316 Transcript_132121/m.254316 type:complete len:205 (+) Transcript_132121:45-659(+)